MVDSGTSEADGNTVEVEDHAALFSAIFGDSGSDCDDDSGDTCIQEQVDDDTDGIHLWEKVEEVEGLWHCRSFLSLQQQQSLLKAIDSEGWFMDPQHNQAMRFNDLPQWATDLSALIRSSIYSHQTDREKNLELLEVDGVWKKSQRQWHDDAEEVSNSPLPAPLLQREPLFDQMIVNSYQPGNFSSCGSTSF